MASLAARPSQPLARSVPTAISGVLDTVEDRADNNYVVLRLRGEDGALTRCIGVMPQARHGLRLRLQGQWNGTDFHFDRYWADPPLDGPGLIAYLSDVADIPRSLASSIFAAFGEATRDVLDRTPQRMIEVDGVNPATLLLIQDRWARHDREARLDAALRRLGVDEASFEYLERVHGGRTEVETALRDNPYLLFRDLPDIDFPGIDTHLQSLGVARDDARRLAPALVHLLRRAGRAGHTHMTMDEAAAALGRVARPPQTRGRPRSPMRSDDPIFRRALTRAVQDRTLVIDRQMLFLPEVFKALANLGDTVTRLSTGALEFEPPDQRERLLAAIADLGPIQGDPVLHHVTADALIHWFAHKVVTITRAPGPGEDALLLAAHTLLAKLRVGAQIVCRSEDLALSIQHRLALPARCADALLGTHRFGPADHHRHHLLPAGAVIVPRAQQWDLPRLYALLDALPDTAPVALLIDPDGAGPDGPGRPLAALTAAGRLPTLDQVLLPTHTTPVRAALMDLACAADWPSRSGRPVRFASMNPLYFERALRACHQETLPNLGIDPIHEARVLTLLPDMSPSLEQMSGQLARSLLPDTEVLSLEHLGGGLRIPVGAPVRRRRPAYRPYRPAGERAVFTAHTREYLMRQDDYTETPLRVPVREALHWELDYLRPLRDAVFGDHRGVVLLLHADQPAAVRPLLHRGLLARIADQARDMLMLFGDPTLLDALMTQPAPVVRDALPDYLETA